MKPCKNCSKEISSRNIFCNNSCQQKYEYSQKVSEWLSGKNFIRQGGVSVPTWIRKYLLEQAQYVCTECKWGKINPFTKTVPLDIDHIDGDAYNNLYENLRVLCPNCHSLKKTFKNTGRRKSTRKNRSK
jgi:5-methylcytosine-specific restriction endonuclease McrA